MARALTYEQKRAMSPAEVCRSCPHDPAEANPCPCGIYWGCDIDGDWYIRDRWARRGGDGTTTGRTEL